MFFRSVGSYDTTAGGLFSRFELEAVEDVEAWSPWRLIRFFLESITASYFSCFENFRTTNFSQECKDIVKAYWGRIVCWIVNSECSRLTCNLIECHQKAILFSIKQFVNQNTIEVDYVRSRSGCDTAASTLHSLRCMMHQSHSMGIVSKLCLTCLQW